MQHSVTHPNASMAATIDGRVIEQEVKLGGQVIAALGMK